MAVERAARSAPYARLGRGRWRAGLAVYLREPAMGVAELVQCELPEDANRIAVNDELARGQRVGASELLHGHSRGGASSGTAASLLKFSLALNAVSGESGRRFSHEGGQTKCLFSKH